MKNTLILASFLALAPFAKGQLLLEALDAPDAIPANWPNNIKFNNDEHLIVSVFDRDFLPYQDPTGPAIWNTAPVPANGVNETQAIDWQGTISTEGFSVKIPITATGSGSLPAYNTTFVVPTNRTEDGIGRVVELSWTPQNYSADTKYITATVKSLGGILNIKKLDINTGLGNDFRGVSLGQFNIPNIGAPSGIYDIRVMAVVPDRNFDVPTSNGVLEHQFAYVPVKGPDGKYWLNNNLGADYANVNSADWNPQQGPKNPNDHKSFGSIFQIGRKADGHELVTWNSNTSYSEKYSSINTLPAGATIEDAKTNAFSRDWNHLYNNNIQQKAGEELKYWAKEGINQPCPIGFKVPTKQEYWDLETEMRALNGGSDRTTAKVWINEKVLFPTYGIAIRPTGLERKYDRSSSSPVTKYVTTSLLNISLVCLMDPSIGVQPRECGVARGVHFMGFGGTNWGKEIYMSDNVVYWSSQHNYDSIKNYLGWNKSENTRLMTLDFEYNSGVVPGGASYYETAVRCIKE